MEVFCIPFHTEPESESSLPKYVIAELPNRAQYNENVVPIVMRHYDTDNWNVSLHTLEKCSLKDRSIETDSFVFFDSNPEGVVIKHIATSVKCLDVKDSLIVLGEDCDQDE